LISQAHYDVVPVNYVSRGIVALGLRDDSFLETYHLTNPDILHYSEVISLLEDQGYFITYVPQDEYKKLLFSNQLKAQGVEYKSSTLSAFKWWYKKEIFDFDKSCVTDCSYTVAKLAKFGIQCPRLDSSLIGVYTDESIRVGYFPKPNKPKSSRQRELPGSKEISI
jgi:hypothetical protein